MRRLIFSLLSLALALEADTVLRERGPYLVFGRKLLWGDATRAGTDQAFVFTPLNPDQGLCVFITNNAGTSKTFTLAVYQTGDPFVPQYTGYENRFRQDTVQGTPSPVGANSTSSAYIHTTAAARVAVVISGSTSGGTADIYAVQTTALGCGPIGAGSQTVAIMGSRNQLITQEPIFFDLLASVRPYASSCFDPANIPTTSTLVTSENYITSLAITNTTATTISVTVEDNQGTPVPLLAAVPVNGNTTLIIGPTRIRMVNGIRWYASAAGLVGRLCSW